MIRCGEFWKITEIKICSLLCKINKIEIIDVNEDDSEDDLEERSSKGFNFKLLIPIILVIVAVCVAAGIFVVKNTEKCGIVQMWV